MVVFFFLIKEANKAISQILIVTSRFFPFREIDLLKWVHESSVAALRRGEEVLGGGVGGVPVAADHPQVHAVVPHDDVQHVTPVGMQIGERERE